ncbi:hypothetical protein TWF694_005181 [Orbilia ellipsospora]|uniref:Uncharacterized protein n=1 Tax=Orbilia ellipsospora TaxID=2528407 RepID=A0AAV9WUU6_9PEZI
MTRSNLSFKIAGLRLLILLTLIYPSRALPKRRLTLPTRDRVLEIAISKADYFPRNLEDARTSPMTGVSESDIWSSSEEVIFHTESDLNPPIATLTLTKQAVLTLTHAQGTTLTLTQELGQGQNGIQPTETVIGIPAKPGSALTLTALTTVEIPNDPGNLLTLTAVETLYQEPTPTNDPAHPVSEDIKTGEVLILTAVSTAGENFDHEQIAHTGAGEDLSEVGNLINLDDLILKSVISHSRFPSSHIPRTATSAGSAPEITSYNYQVRRDKPDSIIAYSLTTLTKLQNFSHIAARSSKITRDMVNGGNEAENVHTVCHVSMHERDEYHWPWATMFYRRQQPQPTSMLTRPKWIDSQKPQRMCGSGLRDTLFDTPNKFKLPWIPGDGGNMSIRQVVQPVEEISPPPPLLGDPPSQDGSPASQRPASSYHISTATSIVCSESTWALVLMFMAIFPIGFSICGTEILVRFIWFRAFPADIKDKVLVQNWRVYKRMIGVGTISMICVLVGILTACFLRNGVCEDLKLLRGTKWGDWNTNTVQPRSHGILARW